MHTRVTLLDWTLLASLVIAWGTSFAMSKVALAEIDPAWIAASRLVVASITLLFCAALYGQLPGSSARTWGKYTWLGIIGNTVPFFVVTWGMHFVSSGVAGLLMGSIPLFIVVLAHFLLPNEKLTWPKTIGFLLGFAGIAVLADPKAFSHFALSGNEATGELAIVFGCICYAVHSISAKKLGVDPPYQQASGVLVTGAIASLILALVDNPTGYAGKSATSWLAVVGLGLLPTGAATVVMYKLMERTGPTFVSMSNYLVPVYSLVFGAITLGEKLSWNILLALLLILAGIYCIRLKPRPLK